VVAEPSRQSLEYRRTHSPFVPCYDAHGQIIGYVAADETNKYQRGVGPPTFISPPGPAGQSSDERRGPAITSNEPHGHTCPTLPLETEAQSRRPPMLLAPQNNSHTSLPPRPNQPRKSPCNLSIQIQMNLDRNHGTAGQTGTFPSFIVGNL